MAYLTHKILENRRRQHASVTAHKRKIRDEVNPQLRSVKRDWWDKAQQSNRKIRLTWHNQKMRVQGLQRNQKIAHKIKVLAHKRRIREEVARRR
ncbi:MAG: hypothetical protein ACE14P_10200 [Methanotrichaceae archaeon]